MKSVPDQIYRKHKHPILTQTPHYTHTRIYTQPHTQNTHSPHIVYTRCTHSYKHKIHAYRHANTAAKQGGKTGESRERNQRKRDGGNQGEREATAGLPEARRRSAGGWKTGRRGERKQHRGKGSGERVIREKCVRVREIRENER